MARFSMEDADNYGGGGGGSFFTLKDDKDKANVRFLYHDVSEVEGYACHRVAVGDKERYVNCLRAYNEPISKCPFCEAQIKVTPRLFIKLYNEDAGECQIWERSKAYFQRLASLSAHHNPLCNEIVEITRCGKKGDTNTSYEFYPVSNSEVNLDDYECSEPLGTIILDKSYEDMNTYLDTGSFPENSTNSEIQEEMPWDKRQPERRTPSNTESPAPRRRAF